MKPAEQLINVLRAKQPRRIMVYMEVQIAGQWAWELYPVSQGVEEATTTGPTPLQPPPPVAPVSRPVLRGQSRPTVSGASRPSMTQGREPAKHVLAFGKFFRENGMRPIAIGDLDTAELFDWHEAMTKVAKEDEKGASPQLEVALEMIEVFLIDREFVPAPKYKTPRRA